MSRKSFFKISNIENTYVRTTTLTCIRMPSILMPVKKGNSQQPSQNSKNGQQRVYVATKTKKERSSKARINNKRGFNRAIDKKERKMMTKSL